MKVSIGNYRKNRKLKVVIDDYDTFSMDNTLAHIIYPALVKFKEQRKKMPGVPSAFFTEEDERDENGNHTDATLDIAEARYMDALDKMIWSFKEISEDYPGENEAFPENGKPWTSVKTEDGHYEVVETGFDFNKKAFDEYHTKLQEGLDLFGKHYRTLWW